MKSPPRQQARDNCDAQQHHHHHHRICLNNLNTQYPVIGKACRLLGWSTTLEAAAAAAADDSDGLGLGGETAAGTATSPRDASSDWFVYWTDSGLGIDKLVRTARSYQRLNHFPGMVQIYRKSHLARSMMRMQRVSAAEYDFFPRTWILPFEAAEAAKYLEGGGKDGGRCIIVKPSGGAQGKGIYLTMTPRGIKADEDAVAQVYISRPLLIDGLKFDLRIYVLVTCVDPLRILIYKEGLVRLCTTPYCTPDASNIDCTYMHLTNYSVNKHNPNFVQNNTSGGGGGSSSSSANSGDGSGSAGEEATSSKRSLGWLWHWMKARGMDSDGVWSDISDVVVKTLIAIQPTLAQTYRSCKVDPSAHSPFTCFELLGFDIMLTDSLRPCLVEVNHMPSLRTDSALDARIKLGLVESTLRIINVSADDRRKFLTRSAQLSQIRLYGSTFGGAKGKRAPRHDTTEEQWERYEKNEARSLGLFQLIHPANAYAAQVTAGRHTVYEKLLSRALASLAGKGAGACVQVEEFFHKRDGEGSPREAPPPAPSCSPSPSSSPSSQPGSAAARPPAQPVRAPTPPMPSPREAPAPAPEVSLAQRVKTALLASGPLLRASAASLASASSRGSGRQSSKRGKPKGRGKKAAGRRPKKGTVKRGMLGEEGVGGAFEEGEDEREGDEGEGESEEEVGGEEEGQLELKERVELEEPEPPAPADAERPQEPGLSEYPRQHPQHPQHQQHHQHQQQPEPPFSVLNPLEPAPEEAIALPPARREEGPTAQREPPSLAPPAPLAPRVFPAYSALAHLLAKADDPPSPVKAVPRDEATLLHPPAPPRRPSTEFLPCSPPPPSLPRAPLARAPITLEAEAARQMERLRAQYSALRSQWLDKYSSARRSKY